MADHTPGSGAHPPGRSPEPAPRTPRWVKIWGTVLLLGIALLVLVALLGGPGGHGPGRHLSSAAVEAAGSGPLADAGEPPRWP